MTVKKVCLCYDMSFCLLSSET